MPKSLDSNTIVDYSGLYKNFYDIFAGLSIDPKGFDLSFAVRDNRNMYAAFVNIMDANAISMKRKYVFEQAPLEKTLQDYYSLLPNAFSVLNKNVNDLELEMKNKGNELLV